MYVSNDEVSFCLYGFSSLFQIIDQLEQENQKVIETMYQLSGATLITTFYIPSIHAVALRLLSKVLPKLPEKSPEVVGNTMNAFIKYINNSETLDKSFCDCLTCLLDFLDGIQCNYQPLLEALFAYEIKATNRLRETIVFSSRFSHDEFDYSQISQLNDLCVLASSVVDVARCGNLVPILDAHFNQFIPLYQSVKGLCNLALSYVQEMYLQFGTKLELVPQLMELVVNSQDERYLKIMAISLCKFFKIGLLPPNLIRGLFDKLRPLCLQLYTTSFTGIGEVLFASITYLVSSNYQFAIEQGMVQAWFDTIPPTVNEKLLINALVTISPQILDQKEIAYQMLEKDRQKFVQLFIAATRHDKLPSQIHLAYKTFVYSTQLECNRIADPTKSEALQNAMEELSGIINKCL